MTVISDGLWRSRFASSPAVLGRALQLNGTPTAIVGVMPPGFSMPSGSELWLPLTIASIRREPCAPSRL